MNKKAIAIDVVKHPIIKKLLEMNIASPSIINRLIIEEIMNEAAGGSKAKGLRKRMAAVLKNTALTAPSSAIIDASKNEKSPEGIRVTNGESDAIKLAKIYDLAAVTIKDIIKVWNSMGDSTSNKNGDLLLSLIKQSFKSSKTPKAMMLLAYAAEQNTFAEKVKEYLNGLKGKSIGDTKSLNTNILIAIEEREDLDKTDVLGKWYEEEDTIADDEDNESAQDPTDVSPLEAAIKIGTDENAAEKAAKEVNTLRDAKIALETSKEKATRPEGMTEEDFSAIFEKAFEAMKVHLPSEEDQADTTEAGTIGKIDAANAYKETIEGKEYSPESAMISFVEEFLKVRHLKDQVSLLDNLMDALDELEKRIKGTDEKALQESINLTTMYRAAKSSLKGKPKEEETSEIRTDVDLSTAQVKTLEQKKAEMIQQLKALSDMMKEIDEKSTSVASRYIKAQVIKTATTLQDIIADIHKEIQNSTLTEEVDSTPKKLSRKDKANNVKAAFANIQPLILNLDKIMDNWEDKEDDSDVDASALLTRVDRIRDIITPIRPYFQLKTSAFTNNRIDFKDLKTMLRKITLQLIDVMKRVDNAVSDEMVEPADANTLLAKLTDVSGLIEKYIGPKSKVGPPIVMTVGDPEEEIASQHSDKQIDDSNEEDWEDNIDNFMSLANLDEKEKEVLKDFFDSLRDPDTKSVLGLEEQITREILRILRESKGILKEAEERYLRNFVDKYGEVNKLDSDSKERLISALTKLKAADGTKFNTYFGMYTSSKSAFNDSGEEKEEESPLGTANRHLSVNDNSVADYLFKQTENDTSPLFIGTDNIGGEHHTNRVLNYLADNKIKMKYTNKDHTLHTTKDRHSVKKGDVITIDEEGSKWAEEGYMKLGVPDGHSTHRIPIKWFLDADNFTVEVEEEEEIGNSYPDGFFNEPLEEQIQRKLEQIIETHLQRK
tara:strand:+ start:1096 stop:3927 length:2832 start_codon:yes stop_codon:yes gene_type:complete